MGSTTSPAPCAGLFSCSGALHPASPGRRPWRGRTRQPRSPSSRTSSVSSNAAVLTEYRGLTVAQLKQLRRQLREQRHLRRGEEHADRDRGQGRRSHGLRRPARGSRRPSPSSPVTRWRRPRVCVTSPRRTPTRHQGRRPRRQAPCPPRRSPSSRTSSPARFCWPRLAGAFKASLFRPAYLFTAPAVAGRSHRRRPASRQQSRQARRHPPTPRPTGLHDAPAPTSPRVATRLMPAPGPAPADQPPRHSWHTQHTEGTAIMAKLSTDELLDAFKELSLIELSEFVKEFEETFEVTAAAPVAVAAAGCRRWRRRGRGRARRRTRSTSSSRPLATRRSRSSRRCVPSRASAWRRPRTSSTAPPRRSSRGVDKEAAEKAKAALEDAGATVTLK